MSRSPEEFRGMNSQQIFGTILSDMVAQRRSEAVAQGASCVRCFDTGMAGGSFCGCSAGAKVSYQANKP